MKRVAIGYRADPALLLRLFEMDVEELDRSFRAWLLAETAATRERLR